MTNVTRLGLNVGGLIDFEKLIGEFYLAFLIINADIFNLFLPADVHDDLVDIISGIEHHGVVGAQFDRIAQALGFRHTFFPKPFFLIFYTEIGPGGYREKQDDADADNKF
jgi:hypothetical protein